jgi:hypothetical protein
MEALRPPRVRLLVVLSLAAGALWLARPHGQPAPAPEAPRMSQADVDKAVQKAERAMLRTQVEVLEAHATLLEQRIDEGLLDVYAAEYDFADDCTSRGTCLE